jgi:transposase
MAVADRTGLPIAISVESASPHEVGLVERTLESRFTQERPRRLIGDRAYDSDPLDERLRKQGIELIAPHKANRKKPRTQDGRPLRRYRNRWKIERLFAWLQNFRRIQTRHEYILENYLAFVLLGCMVIFLRTCF